MWGAGSIAFTSYGIRNIVDVMLFITGPLLVYGVLVANVCKRKTETTRWREGHLPALGLLDFLSVPATLAVALAAYHIPWRNVGIPVGSFASTLVCNLLLAAQLAIAALREAQERQDRILSNEADE